LSNEKGLHDLTAFAQGAWWSAASWRLSSSSTA
jgi:hypothetical protein